MGVMARQTRHIGERTIERKGHREEDSEVGGVSGDKIE
jgi:hypothetical protein